MAAQGLMARAKRRRRSLTRPDKAAAPIPGLVKRDFTAAAINEKWCGDLTEIPCDEGTLYLATVEDLASRRLPGFALGEHHDAELAAGARKMAAATRGGNIRGVVFHSDKGGEYTGDHFEATCVALGVTQSMGRVGSALDNAAAESFTRPSSGSCCPGGTSRPRTRPDAKLPRSSTATTGCVDTARVRCVPRSTTSSCSPPEPSQRRSRRETRPLRPPQRPASESSGTRVPAIERLQPPTTNHQPQPSTIRGEAQYGSRPGSTRSVLVHFGAAAIQRCNAAEGAVIVVSAARLRRVVAQVWVRRSRTMIR